MRRLTYFAVFEPTKTGYSVYFPDLLGCVAAGKTFDEAEKMAQTSLNLHLYEMEKDGDEIVLPTTELTKLQIDSETAQGYAISPITVYPEIYKNEMDNKAVKVNTTIPAWLKEMAELERVNFSEILQNGLREYLRL